MVHTSWNTYTRYAYFAHEQWTSYCLGRELALRFKYLSLGRHAYRGHASDPCWPDKGHVQIRVEICPPRSMFSKFNYFDIVASLHKYACYQINKNPHHGHLWITEA